MGLGGAPRYCSTQVARALGEISLKSFILWLDHQEGWDFKVKVGVFGSGLMGRVVAQTLLDERDVSEVMVVDTDQKRLESLAEATHSQKLSTHQVSVADRIRVAPLINGCSVVVCALPQRFAVTGDIAAMEAGVNIVDIAFEDDQMQLHPRLKREGLALIPGCGLAPGLTNILSRHAVDGMDRAEGIYIKVGGIPENPQPPLGYKVVFSLESVWDEYLKPARIIRDGVVREVPALSGLEAIDFPKPFGRVECFYTDGLSSLLYTMKRRVIEAEEKTIRYQGHAEKIKTLVECGLLKSEPIAVGDTQIAPRRFLTALLSPMLELGAEVDATLMRVDVTGEKNRKKVRYTYEMVNLFDKRRGITSMAKTTAFPGTIVALMLARGEIGGKGVIPPEEAIREDAFDKYIAELSRRDIHVTGPSVRARSSTSSF